MDIRSTLFEKASDNPKYVDDGWMMTDGVMD